MGWEIGAQGTGGNMGREHQRFSEQNHLKNFYYRRFLKMQAYTHMLVFLTQLVSRIENTKKSERK